MTGGRAEAVVSREHVLQTLEAILGGETKTVVLEGVEGIGKSTLLRQFSNAYSERSFALFIAADSRWAYDPLQVRIELCGLLSRRLRDRDLFQDEVVDDRLLGKLLGDADRRARKEKTTYFFVVDGLEDIPESEQGTVRELLALVPFGFANFRFLLSGDLRKLPLNPTVMRSAKSYPVAIFARPDSDAYLTGIGLSDLQLEEVYRAARGVQGNLASIRRRLISSEDTKKVLDHLPEHLNELYALEWHAADPSNEPLQVLLAILAHEGGPHTLAELSGVSAISERDIETLLTPLSFIRLDGPSHIAYDSGVPAVRRHASKRAQDAGKRFVHRLSAEGSR